MSTNIFDVMKLKVLFLLNCESSKYIAKLYIQELRQTKSIGVHIMGKYVEELSQFAN